MAKANLANPSFISTPPSSAPKSPSSPRLPTSTPSLSATSPTPPIDAFDGVLRSSAADELASRAARLQGAGLHGLNVLVTLALLAGRLHGVAWIRRATSSGDGLED